MSGPNRDGERRDRTAPHDPTPPGTTAQPASEELAGDPTGLAVVSAEHAELLRHIHQLAVDGARQHGEITAAATPDITVMAQQVARAEALDRHRIAVEMRARAAGVLERWIGWARLSGEVGGVFARDQLPAMPLEHGRPAAVHQVTQDITRLADMATVAAMHEHHHGPSTEQHGREQLERGMDALWMRAAYTARAAGMTGHERGQSWAMTSRDWTARMWQVMRFSGSDLDMLWQHYTSSASTEGLLRSLHPLREQDHRAGITAGAHADTELLPPAPGYYLTRAREALHALIARHPPVNHAICTAIADVLPATELGREWTTPESDAGAAESSRATPHPDHGPNL